MKLHFVRWNCATALAWLLASAAWAAAPAAGPLRVSRDNPRYFADSSGKIVYLTGAHTWDSLQDMGPADPPPAFDFNAYLDFLAKHDHNFIRLWRWELVSWDTKANREKQPQHLICAPHPWARTGPGNALDGKPKFNLDQFDPAFFDRLRTRVSAARDRGIYVSVMLFEGWGIQFVEGAWRQHPFHPDNNVNKLNGDVDGDGKGLEIHTGASKEVAEFQRAYVRKVIDTVNEFDNVLYEISNENHPPSAPWQYEMIRFIKEYEKSKPKQHPVGMTFQYKGGQNKVLFDSPADWISPNPDGGYKDNPPAADGSKVILNDTDHLWGIGGNVGWVWKSFTRGLNPLFMDPYKGLVLQRDPDTQWEPVRQAMGVTRRLAERMNLAAMTPQPDLASTKYCLANAGKEYLIYVPVAGEVTVDLSSASGEFAAEWINPVTGESTPAAAIAGGAKRTLQSPAKGDAVLHLKSR